MFLITTYFQNIICFSSRLHDINGSFLLPWEFHMLPYICIHLLVLSLEIYFYLIFYIWPFKVFLKEFFI